MKIAKKCPYVRLRGMNQEDFEAIKTCCEMIHPNICLAWHGCGTILIVAVQDYENLQTNDEMQGTYAPPNVHVKSEAVHETKRILPYSRERQSFFTFSRSGIAFHSSSDIQFDDPHTS